MICRSNEIMNHSCMSCMVELDTVKSLRVKWIILYIATLSFSDACQGDNTRFPKSSCCKCCVHEEPANGHLRRSPSSPMDDDTVSVSYGSVEHLVINTHIAYIACRLPDFSPSRGQHERRVDRHGRNRWSERRLALQKIVEHRQPGEQYLASA